MRDDRAPRQVRAPRQIEQTAKRWKLLQAIGAMTMFVCAVWFGLALGVESDDGAASASLVGVLGLIAYVLGRALAWWHHG